MRKLWMFCFSLVEFDKRFENRELYTCKSVRKGVTVGLGYAGDDRGYKEG